ncbi:hypothetical protein chiPu_0008188 [Chiloscyllium punctatum]|uniref:Uncharacterized protein n=1 Tax=Chiloscyllium punctatum TaxID=137246 RepID=A0A401SH53_CHIPU|nr:hypothetical protein [Chiloscyllium punctatum]
MVLCDMCKQLDKLSTAGCDWRPGLQGAARIDCAPRRRCSTARPAAERMRHRVPANFLVSVDGREAGKGVSKGERERERKGGSAAVATEKLKASSGVKQGGAVGRKCSCSKREAALAE